MPVDVRNDYNGDGRSDVIWLNTLDNSLTNWLGQSDGRFVSNFANAYHHWGFPWLPMGVGDFNGDGRDDILWRGPDYAVTNWLAQPSGGFASNFENAFGQVSPGWDVRGIGDFNGDGRDDILWQGVGGQITNWLGQPSGGFASNFENATHHAGHDWLIAGTGDFNGDGRGDVLWRNGDTGAVTNWLGQAAGGFVSNFGNSYAEVDHSTGWRIAGTGDFNGDGRDDILWRNVNGDVTNCLGQVDGSFVGNFANAAHHAGTDWSLAGIGDYNGDGRDDILWQSIDGDVTNWLAQATGGFVSNSANFWGNVGDAWSTFPHYF